MGIKAHFKNADSIISFLALNGLHKKATRKEKWVSFAGEIWCVTNLSNFESYLDLFKSKYKIIWKKILDKDARGIHILFVYKNILLVCFIVGLRKNK